MTYIDEFLKKNEGNRLPIRLNLAYRVQAPLFRFFQEFTGGGELVVEITSSYIYLPYETSGKHRTDRADERAMVYKGTMVMIKHCTIVSTLQRGTGAQVYRCTGAQVHRRNINDKTN